MSFCYNCGERVPEDTCFCPECGAKLKETVTTSDENSKLSGEKGSTTYTKKGIILTNSVLLSKILSVSQGDVTSLLNSYITHLNRLGICYKLVDMDSFSRSNRWYDYHSTLLDIHKREVAASEQESTYLFIIGGNNVIPVPVINNYIKDLDKDIETDMLYSYPYGQSTQQLLESGELFKAELIYTVSRLPLASDATFADLSDFLQRSLNNHIQGGIVMTHAYGQSDPHWLVASSRVVNGTYSCGLLSYYESLYTSQICNGRVLVSPPIDETNIGSVFVNDATLYYFNLHGSDQPDCRVYVGKSCQTEEASAAFFPELISIAQCDNIFAAECCYGAKFVGYDKKHSMLHSALMNKTLLFLGSSRVAYGQVDSNDVESDHAQSYVWADLMCAAFMDGLLCGLSGGEALLYARRMFFLRRDNPYGNRAERLDVMSAISLAEFNLYGDPMLGMITAADKSAAVSAKQISREETKNIADNSLDLGFEIEDVSDQNKSILQRVRGRVDDNIESLTSRIGESLYASYGLSPRKPKKVLKVKYRDAKSDYCVVYEGDASVNTPERTIVITNENGDIKSVGMSK